MASERVEIQPSTKVAQLLESYPELEDVLIRMAPAFKKLKNPLLRRSIAKVASLKQASVAAGLDLTNMVNELRAAVGQPPVTFDAAAESEYLGSAPDWFQPSCVEVTIDDRAGDSDEMAINRILKALKDLESRQVVELLTTFVPAPGIDAARAKGLSTWTVRSDDSLCRTYFAKE